MWKPQCASFAVMRLLLALLAGTVALAACVPNPTADAATAEAINEIGHELGMLRDENATLQMQVDSLKTVVARQDTLLRRVANAAGMPVP